MNQVDWSKAPEGATHCWPKAPEFFKRVEGVWFVWYKNAEEWHEAAIKCRLSELIARPVKSPEWNGEGLPPVGAVCEWSDGEWVTVEIVGSYKGAAVAVAIDNPRNLYIGKSSDYRPIRTPEQVAVDERAKAIDEMLVSATNPMDDMMLIEKYPGDDFMAQLFGCLYNAGYRLTKQD